MGNTLQGLNNISKLYQGTNQVSSMHFQDNQVWPYVSALAGTYFIGGQFTSYQGVTTNRAALLDSNLTSSVSFSPGFDSNVYCAAKYDNDDIIVGGAFNNYNGSTSPSLVKIRPDGSVNTTFDILDGAGAGVNGTVNAVIPYPDGGALIGGDFTQWQGQTSYPSSAPGGQTTVGRLLKLNPDATIDTSFRSTAANGPSGTVFTMHENPDGTVYVGGNFLRYHDSSNLRAFVKINPDGSPDTAFHSNFTLAATIVRSIDVQDDGKILIAGSQQFINGVNRGNVVRLNSDGTLDTTFNISGSFDSDVYAVTAEPSGSAYSCFVGGPFNRYDLSGPPFTQTTVRNIMRIGHDGTLDLNYVLPFGGAIESMQDLGTELLVAKSSAQWNFDSPGYMHTIQKYTSTPLLGSVQTPGNINTIVRVAKKF